MKTNKDKFNYTAVGVMLYHCPCCAAEWRTNKLDYCPNCEVKLIYSAGEEVYVEDAKAIDEFLSSMRYQFDEIGRGYADITIFEEHRHLVEFALKKLTRPTVSEGEINNLWDKYSELVRVSIDDIVGFQCMDQFQFKAAINELNR